MSQSFTPNKQAKILVVGDVILDRYVHGNTRRISPEAPVPVVQVEQTEERPGGAGNVALNIKSLGIAACVVGITGNDTAADNLTGLLENAGVECRFVRKNDFPTITKLRVLSQHQQLLRLDYETASHPDTSAPMLELFRDQLAACDLVVLSDYAKGSLANVEAFIAAARDAGKPVLIDPKGVDFNRYANATVLTPNLKEFEAVVGVCRDDNEIAEQGRILCRSLSLEALVVTRGEQGMTLIRRDDDALHLETHAREVFDVTGAGDTVIAALAAALASGCELAQAMDLANHAAGLAVSRLGAASVTATELNHAIHADDQNDAVIPDKSILLERVNQIRADGGTVVMTNGCFDIIHAGHVDYLTRAAELGDYLVIAVNDDESVRRLKGASRPLNPLRHRLAVLSALKPVDYVIAFSEDTPEALIAEILPDVLVKGGDYKVADVAGGKQVIDNGGEVKILPLFADCSTTQIINNAKSAEGV